MDGVAVIGMFLCRRCGGHGKLQRGAKQDPCPVAGAHDTNLGASRTLTATPTTMATDLVRLARLVKYSYNDTYPCNRKTLYSHACTECHGSERRIVENVTTIFSGQHNEES